MKWYNAKKALPAESVECIVEAHHGTVLNVPFSKKHQAFNCNDEDVDDSTAIEVLYWTTREDFDKFVIRSVGEGD